MRLQLRREMLTQDARRQSGVYDLVAKVVHHGALQDASSQTLPQDR